MPRIAILGSYPDGPESTDDQIVAGRWSAWRIPASSPLKIWQDAKAELEALLQKRGHVNLYVYYGNNLDIEYVLKMDAFLVFPAPEPAPGPTFDACAGQKAHVWVRYAGATKLKKLLKRDSFREVVLAGQKFAAASQQPISEAGWLQRYQTGLIFVEEPALV